MSTETIDLQIATYDGIIALSDSLNFAIEQKFIAMEKVAISTQGYSLAISHFYIL